MQIGEATAVWTTPEGDYPCPFCASKAGPTPEEKRMVSDSSKLGKALNAKFGRIDRTMRHPEIDFGIKDSYYVSEQVSRIGFNAHHIIPGNASLGRCPQILEWMAGTASIDKVFYDEAIKTKVREVEAGGQAGGQAGVAKVRDALIAEKYEDAVLYGDPDMTIMYSAKGKGIHRAREVSTNKVMGQIDYDVNDARNGVWLAGNCAVNGWEVMATVLAVDLSKKKRPFPQACCSVCNRTGPVGTTCSMIT